MAPYGPLIRCDLAVALLRGRAGVAGAMQGGATVMSAIVTTGGTYTHHPIAIVNPGDADWTKHRYVLCFGAGGTRLMVWSNSLDDALDECVDWIAEHAPGLLCDAEVAEEYERAIADGKSEEEAIEAAEQDTTRAGAGNAGHYLNSYEWGIVAVNPTRAEMLELLGRTS